MFAYKMLNTHTDTNPTLPTRVKLAAFAVAAAVCVAPSSFASAGEVDGDYVFPLPSKHQYGDGFGAGRGHDGQDLFAPCGRNLVAAHDGKVQRAENDGSGYGNILVLDVKGSDIDLLYAHLQKKPIVAVGDKVEACEKVGKVGDSGNASGCHLHFEMHSGPGFWEGGQPMQKVTKYLKDWDAYS